MIAQKTGGFGEFLSLWTACAIGGAVIASAVAVGMGMPQAAASAAGRGRDRQPRLAAASPQPAGAPHSWRQSWSWRRICAASASGGLRGGGTAWSATTTGLGSNVGGGLSQKECSGGGPAVTCTVCGTKPISQMSPPGFPTAPREHKVFDTSGLAQCARRRLVARIRTARSATAGTTASATSSRALMATSSRALMATSPSILRVQRPLRPP